MNGQKCYFCDEPATEIGPLTGLPLCEEHHRIYMIGYASGKWMNMMAESRPEILKNPERYDRFTVEVASYCAEIQERQVQ